MKKRVFIVHGWGGNPQDGWYPWLKKKLEVKGFETIAPAMPNTENPKIEIWVPYLAKAVSKVDEITFFVGHSIGCQTILRFLENLPENKKIGGAVFVAGFFSLSSLDENEEEIIAKPWIETPIDLERARSHLPKSIAIFSDNDPYVSLSNKDKFEKELESKVIIEHNMVHFDEGHGITKLPIALKSILEISK